MEGENHTQLVFVKYHEMALYHRTWPNHVIVGLPVSSDTQGLGAARFYIKVKDPWNKWRLDLNNNTLYILSLVLMFPDK